VAGSCSAPHPGTLGGLQPKEVGFAPTRPPSSALRGTECAGSITGHTGLVFDLTVAGGCRLSGVRPLLFWGGGRNIGPRNREDMRIDEE